MPDKAPPWPELGGPLDGANAAFHEAYDDARSSAEESAPVFILLGDMLVLYRGGRRSEASVTPRLYHAIKSGTHAPVALFAALHGLGDNPLDTKARERLGALHGHLEGALGTLTREVDDEAAAGELRSLLEATQRLLERTLAAGRSSRAELTAFARGCGQGMLRLVDHATRVQLHELHARVEEALAGMSGAELAALQVVVAGAHQARERSLGMQYFRKRLREPEGAEERVAFAENVADEAAALALVGTRRFDRALARAFFDDEKRLQRDVLGDAAAAHLRTMDFRGDGGRGR